MTKATAQNGQFSPQMADRDHPTADLCDSGATPECPDDIKAYYDAGLCKHDLTLRHAEERATPVFQSTINDYVFHSPFTCDHTRYRWLHGPQTSEL